jgi:hypothetical protein
VTYSTTYRLEARSANREPRYRSTGEERIGRMLERSGIDFIHEQPTLSVCSGVLTAYGTRTLRCPGMAASSLEYAGMMDRSDYATGIDLKRRVYAANNMPAMFVYPGDLRGPSWPDRLAARLHQTYRCHARRAYRPTIRYRR